MFQRKTIWSLLVLILFSTAALAACAQKPAAPGPGAGAGPEKPQAAAPGQKTPDAQPKEKAPVPVTLYFADKQAMYLVPEERQVIVDQGTVAEAIILELIKGPQNPELRKTIPEGTRLLTFSIKDGTAYVNFSKEFQAKHPGGTAGESMTLYSVVNSLGRRQEIKQVQFLLEGQKQESILGHADTSVPVAPNWNLVSK